MLAKHIASGAGVTVASVKVPDLQCSEFGVIECQGDRISAFHEKPARADACRRPRALPRSMGNYVFTAPFLVDVLVEDAEKHTSATTSAETSSRPRERGEAAVYDFEHNVVGSTEQDTATGATWGPRLLLRRQMTWSRWSRCSASTTSNGDLLVLRTAATRQVRL